MHCALLIHVGRKGAMRRKAATGGTIVIPPTLAEKAGTRAETASSTSAIIDAKRIKVPPSRASLVLMLFKSLDHELCSNKDYIRNSSSHNGWNPVLDEAGSSSCAKICPSHFISSQYFLQFPSTHRKGSPSIDLDYQEREYASHTKLASWTQDSVRSLFPPFIVLVQGELRPRTISLLPHLTSFSFNLAGLCSCLDPPSTTHINISCSDCPSCFPSFILTK